MLEMVGKLLILDDLCYFRSDYYLGILALCDYART